ncbi:uncharacterized protein Dwil_GK27577 [Drosophila willistoni]|uniref:CRAL-TRIO domain-containing protein n=1 Tax=Drosophila willistoni TaxID=7260 RepID=A0A0Q9WT11_DROWI|nr:uncharacterized protein Dwil_GK27577 [Drosophila willistoni]
MSIFDNKIELSLRDGNPRVLKSRDRKGRKILTFLAANWIPQKYTLLDLYRSFLLTIDKLLDNVENQALGFVVIVDWTDVTMNQARYLTPTIIKLMIEGLQDCLPAKFLAIHFICQPWYIGMTSTILKKFLTDEMRNRIFFHGSNLISLHNHNLVKTSPITNPTNCKIFWNIQKYLITKLRPKIIISKIFKVNKISSSK